MGNCEKYKKFFKKMENLEEKNENFETK